MYNICARYCPLYYVLKEKVYKVETTLLLPVTYLGCSDSSVPVVSREMQVFFFHLDIKSVAALCLIVQSL